MAMATRLDLFLQSLFLSGFCGFVSGIELTRTQLFTNILNDGTKNPEVSWGYNTTHIEVQLSYPTLGWLAMGLSPNGGMDQSDVLFGYVDTNNEVVIQDRYLTSSGLTHSVNLSLDSQQDWQMISGSKNETHTTLRAVRKIKTCDAADRPFTDTQSNVIFSYKNQLPTSKIAPVRKHDVRGGITLNFLRPAEIPDPDITKEISKTLEFRVDNRTIEGDEDYHYFCKMTALPQFERKYQSIASQPIVNEKNAKQIHHMLLYMCAKLPEEFDNQDFFECGPKAASAGNFMMRYCQTVIGVWTMGAKPTYYLPENVGLPFTPEMSGLKVALQVHYNNPQRLTFVDDSGMRFLLTDKVREHDSGSIMTGIFNLDFTLTMPPGLDTFHVQGQCSDQCTKNVLPPEGITIFSSFVHMHTRGKTGVARHFRGEEEILPPLATELSYDFNFQQTKPVLPMRKFLPGDRVIVECNFTTANETLPVYGGEGTAEEMCLVFLDYYPKISLNICGGKFKLTPYLKAIGMDTNALMKEGRIPQMRGEIAENMLNSKDMKIQRLLMQRLKDPVQAFMTGPKWKDAPTRQAKTLEDFYSQMTYIALCNGKGTNMDSAAKSAIFNDRPPNTAFYVDPSKTGC